MKWILTAIRAVNFFSLPAMV